MSELDPIRAQIETDLPDEALTALVTAAREAVDERLGPVGPVTEHRNPSGPLFGLSRRAVEILEVTEHDLPLLPEQWRLRPSGLVVERVGRRAWRDRAAITYQPLPDTALREQAVVGLVKIDIRHNPGLTSAKFGSWAETYADRGSLSYADEREAILAALVVEGTFR